MGETAKKYNKNLALYYMSKPLYFDKNEEKEPNVRKLDEQPIQQTKAAMWDELINSLCNLKFIQSKSSAGMAYRLIEDYNHAFNSLPENANNIKEEKKQQEILNHYSKQLILYSQEKIEKLKIPQSIPILDNNRSINTTSKPLQYSRIDILRDFIRFLGKEVSILNKYSSLIPRLTIQLAWNYAYNGPVGDMVNQIDQNEMNNLLLVPQNARPLNKPYNKPNKILIGHDETVNTVAFSADGKFAISGSDDERCIFWNTETGKTIKELHKLDKWSEPINSIAISADNSFLVSGSRDKKCKIWHVNTIKKIIDIGAHYDAVNSVDITPDGKFVISGSNDGSCVLWNVRENKQVFVLMGHSGPVYSVKITASGKYAVSGGKDTMCILWDLSNGKQIKKLEGHKGKVNTVAITPDGKFAISGSDDYSCILWDINTGEKITKLKGHNDWVNAVAITPDGKLAISGSNDKTCILWNLNTKEQINTLVGHSDSVNSVAITPNGKLAISGSSDNNCIIWDVQKGDAKLADDEHNQAISSIAVSPDSKTAYSFSGFNGVNFIWNLDTGVKTGPLDNYPAVVSTFKISPDGKSAIYDDWDGYIYLIDLKNGNKEKTLFQLNEHESPAVTVTFTPDGSKFIYTSNENGFYLKDSKTSKTLKEIKPQPSSSSYISYKPNFSNKIALSPDGSLAVMNCKGKNEAFVWDLKSNTILKSLKGHSQQISSIDFTPEGLKILTGSDDGTCILWDLISGKILHTFKGHSDSVTSLAITKDGEKAFSTSLDKTCILWNLASGHILARYFDNSPILKLEIFNKGIVLGCYSGAVIIIHTNKAFMHSKPVIATIKKIWQHNEHKYSPHLVECPYCKSTFQPDKKIVKTLKSINIKRTNSALLRITHLLLATLSKNHMLKSAHNYFELPKNSWIHPNLLTNCPNCQIEIKINPFIAKSKI